MWLGLEIGNSGLHWGWFVGKTLVCAWDTEYLPAEIVQQLAQCREMRRGRGGQEEGGSGEWRVASGEITVGKEGVNEYPIRYEGDKVKIYNYSSSSSSPPPPLRPSAPPPLPLVLASVVPSQTKLWQTYPNVRLISLDQVPLEGLYSTLGIDRALALWGAGKNWGFPMLVIDAGTALTFTACDPNYCLVGGAILPGLGLQLATLTRRTAQLPTVEPPSVLPQRYAVNTQESMQSGVIYTLIAGIKDFVQAWWELFPQGNVAMTGGDRTLLTNYLQSQFPEIAARLLIEPNLRFWGMREIIPTSNS